ncbi:unnamed protein product [[Candida] boidinii]|nr:unnamed protein product [[Candida] boidinii]
MMTSDSALDTNNSISDHQLNADRSIFEFDTEEDVIVLEPASGSYMELKWINKCLEGKPRHVVAMFNRLQKYMNGRSSLEMFMIKEGVARQDVRELLAVMSEHIITVRHW